MGLLQIRAVTAPSTTEAGQTRDFDITYQDENGVNQVINLVFVPNGTATAANEIEYPANNSTDTINDNIESTLTTLLAADARFSVSQSGGYVLLQLNINLPFIKVDLENKEWKLETIIFNEVANVPPTKGLLLSRSNYYLPIDFSTGQESFEILLWFRQNENANQQLQAANYELTKQKVYDENDSFVVISNFANDFLNPKPITELSTGVKDSPIGNVCLTYVETRETGTAIKNTRISKMVTTQGYSSYFDGFNFAPNNNVLLSSKYQRVPRGGFVFIPFFNNGDADTLFLKDQDDNLIHTFSIPAGNLPEEKIKYLIYSTNALSDAVTMLKVNDDDYIFKIVDECKYDPVNCMFLNRYGVFQIMYFFKQNVRSIEVQSDEFKNAYIENFTYDEQNHQYKQFNKNGRQSVRLTTGFVEDESNAAFDELLLSEKVYLINYEPKPYVPINLADINAPERLFKALPVNVRTNTLQKKTRLVDKLVSYDIDFIYSFDRVNRL